MNLFVYLKIFIRMIFTFKDPGDRFSRMRRVRRLRSITHEFLLLYPNAKDSCGAYIEAHYLRLEDLIDDHTHAASRNDLQTMSFIEGSIDTVRYYIAEAMDRVGFSKGSLEVNDIVLPGKPA
ncbi:MAG: hypothetical protein CL472_07245 [Acidobacteria bacterium]|nr:hypothetical protein [Acidobacteriota bacterium]